MVTIVEFLQARIDEDEERAGSGWSSLGNTRWERDNYGRSMLTPAAVLAECAAKRAIIDSCRVDHEDSLTRNDDTVELATVVLYALAAVYSDHPDYQESWNA